MKEPNGPSEDGKAFDLRLDLNADGNPMNDIHGNVVTVYADNKAADVKPTMDLGAGGEALFFLGIMVQDLSASA